MGSWLKRQHPLTLYHSSDIPYVILEEGVLLCFDNCFSEKENKSEYYLKLSVNKNELNRISTHFYRFIQFPVLIPFEHILNLNNIIENGQVNKTMPPADEDTKDINIIISDNFDLDLDLNRMSDVDETFVLGKDDITDSIRNVSDMAQIITHQDWHRTAVQVTDQMCTYNKRKYCWTKSSPELSIYCYGLSDTEEMNDVNRCFDDIGIPSFSVSWEI